MMFVLFRIEELGTSFHVLRQFVWWHDDILLAVAKDESSGFEKIVQFSLLVDRDKGTVKVQLG